MVKTAFMFPGQGAQYIGMGKDFYESCESSRKAIDTASKITGIDIAHLCFEENEQLNVTEYTQIALYAVEMEMYNYLSDNGVKADVHIGLSLGEYAALTASEVMEYEEGCRVVRKRGIYMEHEVPAGNGAMAAVLGMTAEQIEKTLKDFIANEKALGKTEPEISAANYNCPGQIVISGERQSVLRAMERIKEAGAKRVIELNVSGPFHSPMLTGAGKKLGDELKEAQVKPPVIPYVANVTADYVTTDTKPEEIKELLSKQVYSSVRFEQSIRKIIGDGARRFIEIGPGKTLTGFVKKIAKDMDLVNEITTVNIEKYEDAVEFVANNQIGNQGREVNHGE